MARRLIIGYDESEQGEDALTLGQVLGEVLGADLLVASVAVLPLGRGSSEMGVALSGYSDQLSRRIRERITGPVETRAIVSNSAAGALNDLLEEEEPIGIVLGSGHHGPVGRVLVGSVGDALLSGARGAIAVAPREYSGRSEHRLQRIGVAFNGSEEARAGLNAAVSLAARVHGSLTVIGVNEPLSPGYGGLSMVISEAEFEQSGHAAMERLVDQAVKAVPPDLPTEPRVLDGEAAKSIANVAEQLPLDLLVIGSRGYGPLRRVLLGSVGSKLMRLAPCPVLILPRGAGEDPLG